MTFRTILNDCTVTAVPIALQDRLGPSNTGSVDHEFPGDDGAGSGELALVGGKTHQRQSDDVDGEFGPVSGAAAGDGLPQDKEDGLGDGDRPDSAVEIAALGAFALGAAADARKQAGRAQNEDQRAEGQVSVVVDLAHVPAAGEGGDDQADKVHEGEVDCGVPGEGVADAPVKRVGFVLVEAQDIGAELAARQLGAVAGDAGTDQHQGQPDSVGEREPVREEREDQRAGGEEEDGNPKRPVGEPVTGGISLANLTFVGKFQLSAVAHI